MDIYEKKLQELTTKDAGRRAKLERCCPHLNKLLRQLEDAVKRGDKDRAAYIQQLIASAQKN